MLPASHPFRGPRWYYCEAGSNPDVHPAFDLPFQAYGDMILLQNPLLLNLITNIKTLMTVDILGSSVTPLPLHREMQDAVRSYAGIPSS